MENVDNIYKALGKVFNDPTKLLNHKRKSLTKPGVLPSYNIKGGTSIVEDCNFKLGNKPVLVVTSVAARGLDIKGVELVVNYRLLRAIDDYVYKIGRTGRVGNTGTAISFYDSKEDSGLASGLVDILTEAHQVVPKWLEVEGRQNPEGHHGTQEHRFSSRDIRTPKSGFLGGHPVERNEFGTPDLDEVNVESIVDYAKGEKEKENVEIKMAGCDSSCGEYDEVLCLPSSNVKEENATVSI